MGDEMLRSGMITGRLLAVACVSVSVYLENNKLIRKGASLQVSSML